MRYRERPKAIEATQWFTNGDHPQDYATDREVLENGQLVTKPARFFKEQEYEGAVVRYFRRPDVSGEDICPACDRRYHDHGWIDSGGDGQTVCPGDFIVTVSAGTYAVMKPAAFDAQYTKDRG